MFLRWLRGFGHFSTLSVHEPSLSRLRRLLTLDFISRSPFSAWLRALWLTMRVMSSLNIDWLGTAFIDLFRLIWNVFVQFQSCRWLRWLLSSPPAASNLFPSLGINSRPCVDSFFMSDREFPARLNSHTTVQLAISATNIQPITKTLNSVKEYSLNIIPEKSSQISTK